jgi:hypothetical protein
MSNRRSTTFAPGRPPSRQPPRQILPPPSDRRHRRRQRLRNQPLHTQEAQQRPQRGHHRRGRRPRPPTRFTQHEPEDLGARQPGQIIAKRLRALLQEQARDPLIQPNRPSRHPALDKQIAAKLLNQLLNRRPDDILTRQDAETVQIPKHATQALRREAAEIPLASPPHDVLAHHRRRQRDQLRALSLHPPAHMGKQIQLLLRTPQRITLLHKMHTKPISEPRQRPRHTHTIRRSLGLRHELLPSQR